MSRRCVLFGVLSWFIVLGGVVPVSADFRLERQLALEPGGTFTLDADVGAVTLTGDSTSGVSVMVTSRRDDLDERIAFVFEENAGSVRVSAKRRSSGPWSWFRNGWSWSDNTRFTIRVPRQTAVDIRTAGGSVTASELTGSTQLRTSGGSVRAEGIEGRVEARTSGGSIRLLRIVGDVLANTSGGGIEASDIRGALRADTSGGSIQVDAVSGDLSADTSGGSVRIREAGGRVEAHSSGGSVTVAFARGNDQGGELTSSGGGVRATLDPAVALTIDASASGGGVSSDLPVTTRGSMRRNALRGELNGGGNTLRLRTSGGGVRIASSASTISR